jgi:membrane-associated protease RseP (regulator of RpoE activity)
MGALVTVAENGPFAEAGAPAKAGVIVTRIDGERIVSGSDLRAALDGRQPGDTLAIEAYVSGERRTYEVALGRSGQVDGGWLGVGVRQGTSGLVLSDLGIDAYPAAGFLSTLGGDVAGGGGIGAFLLGTVRTLTLPLASVVSQGVTYNFAGFVGPVTNFYTLQGPLAALGGWVFGLANVLFWMGWVNIQLAFFNCIPSFPLDGGHILRTTTEAVVSRLPVSAGHNLTGAVTTVTSLTMLASLLLALFGPQLLN